MSDIEELKLIDDTLSRLPKKSPNRGRIFVVIASVVICCVMVFLPVALNENNDVGSEAQENSTPTLFPYNW